MNESASPTESQSITSSFPRFPISATSGTTSRSPTRWNSCSGIRQAVTGSRRSAPSKAGTLQSYAQAAQRLAGAGYTMLAVGGLVRSRTPEILAIARGVAATVGPEVRLHLLGVARDDILPDLARLRIFSFDSASPMRTSWMSATKNYLAGETHYTAIRIPYAKPEQQGVRGDNILTRNGPGASFAKKERLERAALAAVRGYARRETPLTTPWSQSRRTTCCRPAAATTPGRDPLGCTTTEYAEGSAMDQVRLRGLQTGRH